MSWFFFKNSGGGEIPYSAARSGYFNPGRNQFLSGSAKAAYALGTAATFAYWVKNTSLMTVEADIISNFSHTNNTGFQLALGQFAAGNGTSFDFESGIPLPTVNTWVHVMHVYNGTTYKTYHDNVEVSSLTGITKSIAASPSDGVTIGQAEGHRNTTAHWFIGNLKDVAVFNVAFDSTERAELYNSGVPFDYRTHSRGGANMVGFWPLGLDVDTASSIKDLSSQTNHLTASFNAPVLSFSTGASQYLSGGSGTGSVLEGATSFTIATLFRDSLYNISANNGTLFAKDDRGTPSHRMHQTQMDSTGGSITFYSYNWDESTGGYKGYYFDTYTTRNDSWYWVVTRFDSTGPTAKADLNSTPFPDTFNGGTMNGITDSTAEFGVGVMRTAGTSDRLVTGDFSNLGIWSRALSDAEVAEIVSTKGSFDFRVDSGDYAGSADLVNFWLYGPAIPDLTTANSVVDLQGNKNLNPVNFTNTSFKPIFSEDVP
jgi:hypothetical protein